MSAKRLSPAAIISLKEALCSIYWYKSDLRSFLSNCTGNPAFIGSLNWDNYKRQIVADLIDELTKDHESHLGALTKLCYEVTSITTFSHLEQLDGGAQKARRAKEAVEQLKQLVEPHQDKVKDEEASERRRKERAEKLKSNSAVREKLKELNSQFMSIATGASPQTRGFDLERLMYDLFELFDLDPKASFKNTGEQIDGAFSLELTDYLFEAKWQNELVGVQDLDGFASKVRRKLDNTLGLFLSMNGFSPDGIAAHSTGRPSVILMDGADLMAVLEERIDFVTLLVRKKKHAAQTGNIFLHVHEISQ
ncbi:MAG: restriction endonuclease [Chromatiaceae bacterium]|nr:restriction endonuclease [Chromatiaceae bacterium]